MHAHTFPDRNMVFSDLERLDIVRCAAYIPRSDLEFSHANGYETASISFCGKEWCILRQGPEVMVASISSDSLTTNNTEIKIEFTTNSIRSALIKLINKLNSLSDNSILVAGIDLDASADSSNLFVVCDN